MHSSSKSSKAMLFILSTFESAVIKGGVYWIIECAVEIFSFYSLIVYWLSYVLSRQARFLIRLARTQGSLEDCFLVCNILVLVTGSMWLYLWQIGDPKMKQAYATVVGISLLRFGVSFLRSVRTMATKKSPKYQIKSVSKVNKYTAERPVMRVLKEESSCMFFFACSIWDSPPSFFKLLLLVSHSLVAVLKAVDDVKSSKSLEFCKFLFGLLENVVLVVFWCESFEKLQFNYSICYTLTYFMKYEESGTASSSLQIMSMLIQYLYGKFMPRGGAAPHPQALLQRPTSYGFDCFSIVSDLK
ncbi:uncharacterized protein LODBEIA_P38450 [Lodderomyces beijingensis]|uniref:Uncharacterized protein n=1 Tax=Lodderomyces beijingensis TaxID=1775926 RepID=A0ABP0ZRB6_9ASCO